MDVALLWPEVKDSVNASITCLIDVSVQYTILKEKKKRKSVSVSNNKPIVIWIPEVGNSVVDSAMVAIKDCHVKGQPQSPYHAFPQEFQLWMLQHAANSEDNVSSLVLWNNPNRIMRDGGPYQLHFILSKTLNKLPASRNATYDNIPPLQLCDSDPVYYHFAAGGSARALHFLYWFFGFCVIKVFVRKLLRVMNTTQVSYH